MGGALEYTAVLGDLNAALEAEFAAGKISRTVFEGTKAKGSGRARAQRAGSAEQSNLTAEECLAIKIDSGKQLSDGCLKPFSNSFIAWNVQPEQSREAVFGPGISTARLVA